MRGLLVLAGVVALAPSPTVEACGGDMIFPPRVMLVARYTADHGIHHRTFVLDDRAPDNVEWNGQALDVWGSRAVTTPSLAASRKLTLFGSAGTKVVETWRQVYLTSSWLTRPMTADEIVDPDAAYELAIAGEVKVTWHAIEPIVASKARAWLAGFEYFANGPVDVSTVDDTYLMLVHARIDGGARDFTGVRLGNQLLAACAGTPLGVLDDGAARWLVCHIGDHAVATLIDRR